jgi:hypothetical protein
MILAIANNLDPAAAGQYHIPFWHRVLGVISAFGVDIGAQNLDQCADVGSIEDGDCIHILEGSQDLRAFNARSAWAILAFQGANARIRIYGHHNLAAQLLCTMQVANVADMQQIKASVRKNDLIPGGAPLLYLLGEIGQRKNFWGSANLSTPVSRNNLTLRHPETCPACRACGRTLCRSISISM